MDPNKLRILNIFRVKDWIHYLGYTLIGSALAKNFNIVNLIVTSFLLAYAYSFNDYYDKKQKKKYFLIPLIFYFILLPFLPTFSILVSLFFFILFTAYSHPKIWLEGQPYISTFSNSIGFTLLLLLPFQRATDVFAYFPFLILIFLLNTAAQLLHEIVDYKEDKKINKITTTVKFGIRTSLTLFKLCLIVTLLLAILLLRKSPLISLSTIFFSLLFLKIKKVNRKIRRKFKELGILVGIIYLIKLT